MKVDSGCLGGLESLRSSALAAAHDLKALENRVQAEQTLSALALREFYPEG